MAPTGPSNTYRKSNMEDRALQRRTSAVAKRRVARTQDVDVEQKRQVLSAKKKDLETRLAATKDEEQPPIQVELARIEAEIARAEEEKRLAEEEEKRATEEERTADEIYDDMDIDEQQKPTVVLNSVEGLRDDVDQLADKLKRGLRLPDPPESLDLTTGIELRDNQAVICYKNGFGKPAIVLDNEIPDWPIYRIRKDVLIQDGCPNLMKSRRAGKVKHTDSDTKWSVDDISKIQGIAIEVPAGYLGNPEELVELKPRPSGAERDRLKKEKKPIPRLPDVQLLIEWKTALGGEGEDKDRLTSWESRSGCRTLWKKHLIADALLLRVATQREGNYRKAGGKHSSEERGLSPFEIPRAGTTPEPGDTPDPGRTPTPEDSPDPHSSDKKSHQVRSDGAAQSAKHLGSAGDAPLPHHQIQPEVTHVQGIQDARKAAMAEFKEIYLLAEGFQQWADLSTTEKAQGVEAFNEFWTKKQQKLGA